MTTSKKTIVAAAAGVMALGAGLGISSLASADPTPSTPTAAPSGAPSGGPGATPTAPPSGAPNGGPGWRGGPGRLGHGPQEDALATQLAAKLGIDKTKVSDALKAVRDETRPTARPTPGNTRPDPADQDAALAKALAVKLGVDEARVKTALDEIRATRAADRASALKTRLDAAVKAGTLTQAEADAVTKAVEKGVIDVGPR
jgi:hypothetical protein